MTDINWQSFCAELGGRLQQAQAERDSALDALSGVMRTLSKSSPGHDDELRAWSAALALLAEHGLDSGAAMRERAEVAWAEREAVRLANETDVAICCSKPMRLLDAMTSGAHRYKCDDRRR